MSKPATTPTTPSTPDQPPTPSHWVVAFHAHDLLDAFDKAEAQVKGTGIQATNRLTDAQHLAIDQAHADFWGAGPDGDYANRVLSTAVFYLGAAVKASSDPARTLRALHIALNATMEG